MHTEKWFLLIKEYCSLKPNQPRGKRHFGKSTVLLSLDGDFCAYLGPLPLLECLSSRASRAWEGKPRYSHPPRTSNCLPTPFAHNFILWEHFIHSLNTKRGYSHVAIYNTMQPRYLYIYIYIYCQNDNISFSIRKYHVQCTRASYRRGKLGAVDTINYTLVTTTSQEMCRISRLICEE